MSKNLARISYVLALAGLKNSGSGGGGSTGESETPYQYMLKKGYVGTESQFVTEWKASLNPLSFSDQLLSYLVSIGYNQADMVQADKYILSLVNGEIKPTETFYQTMQKLVPDMTERDINTIMIDLLTGKLTSKEMYKMLTDKGYTDTIENMQAKLYELFTSEFANKESLNNVINDVNDLTNKVDEIEKNCVNPYEYAKTLDNSIEKSTFDKYYLASVNGNSFYQYTQDIYPTLTKDQVNKKMVDLLSGALDPVSAYKQAVNYGFNGTEQDFANNFLDMANGLYLKKSELPEQITPYTYLTNVIGEDSVTQEEFNKQYLKLAKGELDKQDIYNYLLAHGMDSSIAQETVDTWLVKLVSGDLAGQTPYEYAVNLGSTQTKDDFDYQFFTLLCRYLVDGGNGAGDSVGGAIYPGPWTPDPAIGISLYDMYVSELGYQGTQEELYTQLERIAYTLLASGGDASNDETHTGSNDFSAEIPTFEPHECYVSELSGGNATGDEWGGEIFDGEYNGKPYVSDSLYNTMVQQGYKYSQEQLSDQLNELMNYENPDVVVIDGGGSDKTDAEQEYNGQLPEVRNAILQYMIDELNFNPTPQNIENFDTRFGELVDNGNQGS